MLRLVFRLNLTCTCCDSFTTTLFLYCALLFGYPLAACCFSLPSLVFSLHHPVFAPRSSSSRSMTVLMDVDDDVEPHDERRRQQRVYPLQDWAWEVQGHDAPVSCIIPKPPCHGPYLRRRPLTWRWETRPRGRYAVFLGVDDLQGACNTHAL